jgi:hypothetical protein
MNRHTLIATVPVGNSRALKQLIENEFLVKVSRSLGEIQVLVNPNLYLPQEMSDEEYHKALTLWNSLSNKKPVNVE